MNARAAALSLALMIAATAASAQSTSTANYGNVSATALSISLSTNGKISLAGKARIKSVDKTTGATLEADARKIIFGVTRTQGGTQATYGIGGLESAVMEGPVKIVYTETGPDGNTVKTTATADNAKYDGNAQIAELTGNVKIVSENPAMFDEPAVMMGDTAMVNLKSDLGPDDTRFKVESTSGLSSIEVTPKKELQESK